MKDRSLHRPFSAVLGGLLLATYLLFFPAISLAAEPLGEAEYKQGAKYMSATKGAANPVAAVEAWSRASAAGHPAATYNLGQMYLVGEGVVKDVDYARALFEKSDALGVSEARQALDRLDASAKLYVKNANPTGTTAASEAIFAAPGKTSMTCGNLLLDEKEVAQWSEDHSEKPFLLQLFSSAKCGRAAQYVGKLNGLEDAKIFLKSVGGEDIYAVMVGSFKDKDAAKDYAQRKNFSGAWAQSIFSLTKTQR